MNFKYETERLILKILTTDYAPAVLQFLQNNREFFSPYEAVKNGNYYTLAFQQEVLKMELSAFQKLQYIRYYVFKKGNVHDIIGTISFGNILNNPYSSASIGYKFDRSHLHMGYATEAASAAVLAVLKGTSLHRINAYVIPDNTASIHVLERIGFAYEGRCREFAQINGIYTDHLHYALVSNKRTVL